METTGRMSVFGGPWDKGMTPGEGLALMSFFDVADPEFAGLWLPRQPDGLPGLSHRLNPDAHYIAMRWDYTVHPRSVLRGSYVVVTNAKGQSVHATPVDWGPNVDTGRICDVSPGVAKALGLETDDVVTVEVVTES